MIVDTQACFRAHNEHMEVHQEPGRQEVLDAIYAQFADGELDWSEYLYQLIVVSAI